VQELGGLIFSYLGPEPVPLLPRYNVLVWDHVAVETNGTVIPCNWLQVMENLLDPLHVECLHGRYFTYVLERKGGDQLQEFLAHHAPSPMKKVRFDLFEHGIIERHMINNEEDESWRTGAPSFFPTTSLLGSPGGKSGSIIFVAPIDDTHTWFLLHMASRVSQLAAQESIPFFDVPGVDETGKFITDAANGQDHMAVVSQGNLTRRDLEHLGTSDRGIILYRELLLEQMERVERGEEPMNVYRDPARNHIIDLPAIMGDY
jgi:5,5'-dehydrodivanillate O-demethylase